MWQFIVEESKDGKAWREHSFCPTMGRAYRSALERAYLGYWTRVRGPSGNIHVTYDPKMRKK